MSLPTPYWTSPDGRHVIYNQNCLDVLPHLTGVDAVVTDPPYGIDYKPERSLGKCKKWQSQKPFEAVAFDNRPFDPAPILSLNVQTVLWGGNHYASKLPDSGGWLIWDKKRGGTLSKDFIGSDVELAWANIQGTAKIFQHMWCGLCRDSEIGVHLHTTQKPVALMVWCLSFIRGDVNIEPYPTILDPFMGSGTTGVACIRTGRRFIGVEIELKYCKIAALRMERELSQPCLPTMEPERAKQEVLI